MPYQSKAGLATRQTMSSCISSHCSKVSSMSPTCARCWRCGWVCLRQRSQVATFPGHRLLYLAFQYSLYHSCWLRRAVGCSCWRGDTQEVYSSRSNHTTSFSVSSTFSVDDAFLLHLPWTRNYPSAGYTWSNCMPSHGPVINPRSAGVAKLFRKQLYE